MFYSKSDTNDSPTNLIESKRQFDKYFVDYRIKINLLIQLNRHAESTNILLINKYFVDYRIEINQIAMTVLGTYQGWASLRSRLRAQRQARPQKDRTAGWWRSFAVDGTCTACWSSLCNNHYTPEMYVEKTMDWNSFDPYFFCSSIRIVTHQYLTHHS